MLALRTVCALRGVLSLACERWRAATGASAALLLLRWLRIAALFVDLGVVTTRWTFDLLGGVDGC